MRLNICCSMFLAAAAAGGLAASNAMALVTSWTDASQSDGATVDGTIGGAEYNGYEYTGGGTGFGGTLGNGRLSFDSDATTLYVGANFTADLGNNIVALFLDTKSGGFSNDSTLGDFADGGRRVASTLTSASSGNTSLAGGVQDNLPINADYVLEFGKTFTNVFELKTGSLNFIAPASAGTGGNGGGGSREASLSLATLGLAPGGTVNFFAVLISDTGFSSNEGLPNPGFSGNPGFAGSPVTWPDYHQFNVAAAVPEASSAIFAGAAALASAGTYVWRRRRDAAISA